MTFEEFKEINDKYNYSMMFSNKLKVMSKEEYEELVKSLIETIEDFTKEKMKYDRKRFRRV